MYRGLHLFLMHLYVKGWFPVNLLLPHRFVSGNLIWADLWVADLFICQLFIWQVPDVLIAWLNILSFYFCLCFILQFLTASFIWVMFHPWLSFSEEAQIVHMQESTSLLPVCALKFQRSSSIPWLICLQHLLLNWLDLWPLILGWKFYYSFLSTQLFRALL